MALHLGCDEEYEECSPDDEFPEEDSSECIPDEYPNEYDFLKNFRKSSNRKNKKGSQMGIGHYLSMELDLNSLNKDRIRCSTEMWDFVLSVASVKDNQVYDLKRCGSRVGGQYQVGEIPACARKRKKAPEREIIFTRKRKASLSADLPLESPKNNPAECSLVVDVSRNSKSDQIIQLESPSPRTDMAPVVWNVDCRFQPSYLYYAEWSRREKRDLERKRKRKEVQHSTDSQKKRSHSARTGHTECNTSTDTASVRPVESVVDMDLSEGKEEEVDIEAANDFLIDEYLRNVSILSEEFVDPGSLIRAPLSLATRGPSESRITESVDRMNAQGAHKLTLCTVLRVLKLTEEDSRRRYSLLLQGAVLEPPEGSDAGVGSGSGPFDPNPSLGLTPVLSNTEGQSALSNTATHPSSSSSSSASSSSSSSSASSTSSSTLSSPVPTDDALPVVTMRPKVRAPSFSYPFDALETDPTPPQKTEVRIRKMPICTLPNGAITAVSPAIPPNPSTPMVHFALSPATGCAASTSTGSAPVVCVSLGQGSESGVTHRWVEVSDGTVASRAIVPLSVCRYAFIGRDIALSALHAAKYCPITAIAALRSDMIAESSSLQDSTGPSSSSTSTSTLPSTVPVASNASDTMDRGSGISPLPSPGAARLRASGASTEIQFSEEDCCTEKEHPRWSEMDIPLFVRGYKTCETKEGFKNVRHIFLSINDRLMKKHNKLYFPPPPPVLLPLKIDSEGVTGSTGTTDTPGSGQDHPVSEALVSVLPLSLSDTNTEGDAHTIVSPSLVNEGALTVCTTLSLSAHPTDHPSLPPTDVPILKLKTMKDITNYYYSSQYGVAEDFEDPKKTKAPQRRPRNRPPVFHNRSSNPLLSGDLMSLPDLSECLSMSQQYPYST